MARLREYQLRVLEDKPVSRSEYRELILWLQGERTARAKASRNTPTKKSTVDKANSDFADLTALLNEPQPAKKD